MLTVDIGIGHQDDLVVPKLGEVELIVDSGAQGGDDGLDFGVLQHPVDAGLLDVDDLAAQWQDRLEHRVAAALSRAAGRVTLHHIQLALLGIGGTAVGQLAGQAADIGGALAAHQLARLTSSHPCLSR